MHPHTIFITPLHISPANYNLLAAERDPYKKVLLLEKNNWKIYGRKNQEIGPLGKKKYKKKEQQIR